MSGAVDYLYLEKNTGILIDWLLNIGVSDILRMPEKIEEISHFANEMVLKISALASKMDQIKKMKALYFVIW